MTNPVRIIYGASRKNLEDCGAADFHYLGESYKSFLDIGNLVPDGSCLLPPGKYLDNACYHLKDAVIDLDSEISPSSDSYLFYLATTLSERSSFQEKIFSQLVRAKCFLDITDHARQNDRNCVFIVDDIVTGQALFRVAGRNDLPSRFILREWGSLSPVILRLHDRIALMRQIARGFLKRMTWLGKTWQKYKQYKQLRKSFPLRRQELAEADILVFAWGKKDSFSSAEQVRELDFLGRLPGIFLDHGRKSAYLVRPMEWLQDIDSIYRTLLAAKDVTLTTMDGTGWRSLLAALRVSVTGCAGLKPRFTVADTDLGPVLGYRFRDLWANGNGLDNLNDYFALRSLDKKGLLPDCILHQYEGQPWEHMLDKAVKSGSDHQVTAYVHAPFAPLYLSFFPSSRMIRENIFCDTLILPGSFYKDIFKQQKMHGRDIPVGGSLRFEALSRPENFQQQAGVCPELPDDINPDSRVIILPFPVEYNESLEMLIKTDKSLEFCDNAMIIATFHPVAGSEFARLLQEDFHKICRNTRKFVFSTQKSAEILPFADGILYNSSATVFEALALGHDAAYVSSDLSPDLNKCPETLVTACRSPGEIAAWINQIPARPDKQGKASPGNAKTVDLSPFFGPVAPDVWIQATGKSASPDPGKARAS